MSGFPPEARLHRPAEYQRVFENGKRLHEPLLTAVVRSNGQSYARLGLVVSRRVDPRAVGRNAIKRQIRESFRLQRKKLPSVDIVIMARSRARGAEAGQLRRELDHLWKRVHEQWQNS